MSADIAIVGMACRFPGCGSVGKLWEVLVAGGDAITPIPKSRWSAARVYDPDPLRSDRTISRWGGFLPGIDEFDPAFFNISPAEARSMDPQQRLLLELSWEALEDAGISRASLVGSRTGVFVGISVNEYGSTELSSSRRIDALYGTSNALSIAANRISYCFDLRGPSIAVDTACSSSLVAAHIACQSLRARECDVAIVGGVNVILSPAISICFSKAGVMSRDGRCKTFDARANGYVRSEGCGVVVLRRAAQARDARDRTYAIIRGSAVNHDGRSNGLMAPRQSSQEDVLRSAYRDAAVAPLDVDYVEAHGTGTLLGDAIEAKALGAVLGEGRSAGRPLVIGSLKSNIGHLEAAAGIAGLIKTALVLNRGHVPPTVHYQAPNPQVPFKALGLQVADRGLALPARPAIAGVSSFGFGGANAHMVLSAAPAETPLQVSSATGPMLVPVSARTPTHLIATAHSVARAVASLPATSFPDVGYTLQSRREHFECRAFVVAEDAADLASALHRSALDAADADAGDRANSPRSRSGTRSLTFVFPGQSGDWHIMLGRLAEYAAVAAVRAECNATLERLVPGLTVRGLSQPSETPEALSDITRSHLGFTATQILISNLLMTHGMKPAKVVGHSLGEIGAVYAAGMLTVQQALTLAFHRGEAISRHCVSGRMAIAGISVEEFGQYSNPGAPQLWVAATNAPQAIVVSGSEQAVQGFVDSLKEAGRFAHALEGVTFASHCPLMQEASEALERLANGLQPAKGSAQFWSCTDARALAADELGATHWGQNLRQPVRFAETLRQMLEEGVTTVVEIAPARSLRSSIQSIALASGQSAGLDTDWLDPEEGGDLHRQALGLAGRLFVRGCAPDWSCLGPPDARTVSLPPRAWLHQRFWKDRAQTVGGEPEGAAAWRRVDVAAGPGRRIFERTLGPVANPEILDHKLGDHPLMPAAGWLASLRDLPGVGGRVVRLHDVSFKRPLWLQPGRDFRAQCVLESKASTTVLRLYAHHSDDNWQEHVQAELDPAAPGDSVDERRWSSPAELKKRCTQEVPVAGVYESLLGAGLSYGERFRRLSTLWKSDDDALARIERWTADAASLDAALHPVAALLPASTLGGRNGAYVPKSIESVLLMAGDAEPIGEVWSHVSLRPGAREDALTADVRVVAADGSVLVALLGVVLVKAPLQVAEEARSTATEMLYSVAWQQLDVREKGNNPLERALVLGDGSAASAKLEAALRAAGVRTAFVELRVGAGKDALIPHFDRLGASRAGRTAIVCSFGSPGADGRNRIHDPAVAHEADVDTLGAPVRHALDILHALAQASLPGGTEIYWLTSGAQPAHESDVQLSPAQASVWGLARTVTFEMPDVQLRCIDLDPDPESEVLTAASLIQAGLTEREVAVRGGSQYAPRLVRCAAPDVPRSAPLFADDGTYIVTGGLGGLGLAVAGWVAERCKGKIALLASSDPSPAQLEKIEALKATGASVGVHRVDVADRVALERILAQLRSESTAIRGVFHLAAVLDDRALLRMDAESLARVLRPKAFGAHNILELTSEDPLDFLAFFSSAASVLGSPGQANYAAANAFVDTLAVMASRQERPVVSINWGPWDEIGRVAHVAAGPRSPQLVKRIQPAVGFAVLRDVLSGVHTHVCVLPYEIENIIHLLPAADRVAFFSETLGRDVRQLHPGPAPARVMVSRTAETDVVEARNELERTIVDIWKGALGIPRIGVEESLFELGGDSVFASQVLVQVNRLYGVTVPAEAAFRRFTVARLGELVEEQLLRKVASMPEEEAARRVAQ